MGEEGGRDRQTETERVIVRTKFRHDFPIRTGTQPIQKSKT